MGINKTFASRIGEGSMIFSTPKVCKLFALLDTLVLSCISFTSTVEVSLGCALTEKSCMMIEYNNIENDAQSLSGSNIKTMERKEYETLSQTLSIA